MTDFYVENQAFPGGITFDIGAESRGLHSALMERSDFRAALGSDAAGRTVVTGVVPPGVARIVVIDDRGDEVEATLAGERIPFPERGPAVALACPPDAPLTRTEVPPRPDPMPEWAWEPDDESLHELLELPIHLTPFLTAPSGWDENRYEFALQLAGGERASQLLGNGTNAQGEDPAGDDRCLLLNLPEHPGMEFGDGGSLAILIGREDLAAGRYDRLATEQEMY